MLRFFRRLKSAIAEFGMGWQSSAATHDAGGAEGQLPEAMLASLIENIADRYVVSDVVGRGGMALVFRAHDVRHDRTVALKIMRPVTPQRFYSTHPLRLDHPVGSLLRKPY